MASGAGGWESYCDCVCKQRTQVTQNRRDLLTHLKSGREDEEGERSRQGLAQG